MTTADGETEIFSAAFELAETAARMRPKWDRDQFTAALAGCRDARWTWRKTFARATQIMNDPAGTPADLVAAVRSPVERQTPSAPTDEWRAAREALNGAQPR